MESIRELYCIGQGPSSSHTMGPRKAANAFKRHTPDAASYRVYLYGSLSLTGKGHLTNVAVEESLKPKDTEIVWKKESMNQHSNGMVFEALDEDGKVFESKIYFSPGGGAIVEAGQSHASKHIYELNTFDEIKAWSLETGKPIWKYVEECEGEDIWEYLRTVWLTMKSAVKSGVQSEGVLPGILKLQRRSRGFFLKSKWCADHLKRTGLLASYALAVSEENAAGGTIVTAPTCGACGVVPAVVYYLFKKLHLTEHEVLRALAVASIIGNLTKFNASISGAEAGCQAEIGTACAMAAAAATQLMGGSHKEIECAAEMGMEHHLGLTCDPIAGLVQIPCIERNSIAATRAMDCADMALLSGGQHRITFDEVVATMYQTGLDMNNSYKETSLGGLATLTKQSRDLKDQEQDENKKLKKEI